MDHYQQASRVLADVMAKKGSIKTLALAKDIRNKRFVTALVTETLRHKSTIDTVLHRSNLHSILRKQIRDPHLLSLLLYDLLFGKGIQGGGSVKRTLKQHEPALRRATEGLTLPEKHIPKQQQEGGEEGGTAAFPRYARVNTLKLSLAEARAQLLSPPSSLPPSSSSLRFTFEPEQIKDDEHIPNLLLFPPGCDLHDHPLVKSGALILQDKASCFPAHVLLGQEGGRKGGREGCWWVGDVIDACAAPGNKTSHAAALLQEQARGAAAAGVVAAEGGKKCGRGGAAAAFLPSVVYAFDRDRNRLDILRERVIGLMGAEGGLVVPLLQDFLAINPQQQQQQQQLQGKGGKKGKKKGGEGGREGGVEGRFREVRAIMLDPSCSGSGMVKSMERKVEEEEEGERRKGGRKTYPYHSNDEQVEGGGAGEGEEEEEEEEERKSIKAVIKEGGATQRLRALSQFQFKALVKALIDFPRVNRVVYSTCSVHVEENEMVVAAALAVQGKYYGEAAGEEEEEKERGEAAGEEKKEKKQQRLAPFELVTALPSWHRRGLAHTPEGRATGLSEEEAKCLVRTDPKEDLTNGFFVAYFERKGTGGAGKEVKVNVKGGGGGGGGGGKKGGGKKTVATPAVVPVGGTKRPREEGEGQDEKGGPGGSVAASGSKQNKSAKRRERRKKQKKLAGEGGGEGEGEGERGGAEETAE